MVLQNAGSPGGRAYPIAFLRWPGTAHPAAQCTHGTGAAEEQGSSSPRRRGNEDLDTAVLELSLWKPFPHSVESSVYGELPHTHGERIKKPGHR